MLFLGKEISKLMCAWLSHSLRTYNSLLVMKKTHTKVWSGQGTVCSCYSTHYYNTNLVTTRFHFVLYYRPTFCYAACSNFGYFEIGNWDAETAVVKCVPIFLLYHASCNNLITRWTHSPGNNRVSVLKIIQQVFHESVISRWDPEHLVVTGVYCTWMSSFVCDALCLKTTKTNNIFFSRFKGNIHCVHWYRNGKV